MPEWYEVEVTGSNDLITDDPEILDLGLLNGTRILLVLAYDPTDAAQKALDALDDYDEDRILLVTGDMFNHIFVEDSGTGEVIEVGEDW